MTIDWEGMAGSLVKAIFEADIPVEQKEAIFVASLKDSPLARRMGVEFEKMRIANALRTGEGGGVL